MPPLDTTQEQSIVDQPVEKQTVDVTEKRRAGIRRFAFKVFMIFVPLHAYVGWSLVGDLPVGEPYKMAAWAFLGLSTVLIPCGTLASAFFRNYRVIDWLVWTGSMTMGLLSSVLVFTLGRDLVLLWPGTEDWTAKSAVIVVALSALVTIIGFVNARRVAKVVRVSVSLKDLPKELEGFTIAQITDVHVGPTIKGRYLKGIVRKVNALNADVIAITGDMVDGKVDRLAKDTKPLSELESRHGAYVVTGNHEYYSGADAWIHEFKRLGLIPLQNSHVVIHHNNARLVLAGINDYSAHRFDAAQASDPEAALAGSPEGAPKIMLAHQPRSAAGAAKAGANLQLSGHTHGGQFWPWNHFVRMQQPFTNGLRRLNGMWVYTSRGTGYWGPPKRFGAPSEITLITLKG